MSTNFPPTEPVPGGTEGTGFENTDPENTGPDFTASVHSPAETIRQPRVGTIVWGLVAVAIGVIVLLSRLAGFSFDPGELFIGLLIGAGLALIIGGLITAVRPSRRRTGRDSASS